MERVYVSRGHMHRKHDAVIVTYIVFFFIIININNAGTNFHTKKVAIKFVKRFYVL